MQIFRKLFAIFLIMIIAGSAQAEKSLLFEFNNRSLSGAQVIVVGYDRVTLGQHGELDIVSFIQERRAALGDRHNLPSKLTVLVPSDGNYATKLIEVSRSQLKGSGYEKISVASPSVNNPWFPNIRGTKVLGSNQPLLDAKVYCLGTTAFGQIEADGTLAISPRLQQGTQKVTLVVARLGYQTVWFDVDVTKTKKVAGGKKVVVVPETKKAELAYSRWHQPQIILSSKTDIYDSVEVVHKYIDHFNRLTIRPTFHDLVTDKYYFALIDLENEINKSGYSGKISAVLGSANVSSNVPGFDQKPVDSRRTLSYTIDTSGIKWKNYDLEKQRLAEKEHVVQSRRDIQSEKQGEFDPRLKRIFYGVILGILIVITVYLFLQASMKAKEAARERYKIRGLPDIMLGGNVYIFRDLQNHKSTLQQAYGWGRNNDVPKVLRDLINEGLSKLNSISQGLLSLRSSRSKLEETLGKLRSLLRRNVRFMSDCLDTNEFTFATVAKRTIESLEKQIEKHEKSLQAIDGDADARKKAFGQVADVLGRLNTQAALSVEMTSLEIDLTEQHNEIQQILQSVKSTYEEMETVDTTQFVAEDAVRQKERLEGVSVASAEDLKTFLNERQ